MEQDRESDQAKMEKGPKVKIPMHKCQAPQDDTCQGASDDHRQQHGT